jgi:PAS domain S-box-containing protein
VLEDEPSGVAVRLSLAEHYARLQAENLRVGGEFTLLREALDLTGTGFILTDPRLEDDPIVYANQSFLDLTGYPREEVLGRNCRFLQGPDSEPDRVETMRQALAAEEPVTVELHNHRRDGTPFVNEVHISPVRDATGQVVRFVGVQVDVTAYRDTERAERRSAFLAEASPLLDASLDLRTTLHALARISVPHLADLCLVDVLDRGEVTRMAAAAGDPAVERALRALPGRYDVDPAGDDPIAHAVRTGRSAILDGTATRVFGPGELGVRGRVRAAMLVPMKARGRTLGVLALAALGETRRFGPEELRLAEDLARRAALALDNARLYEQQRAVARMLQQSLLPERLPEFAGVELAARYRPAGDGTELGGDFYDAFPVDGDRLVMTIGDVTGKGAGAAALTGLTRHTLRTAAAFASHPVAVLGALNDQLLAQRSARGKYCTVAVARMTRGEAGGVRAEVSVAGHPLPLVLRADGSVEALGRPGTLLGWVPDPNLYDVGADLGPGDAIVLYTDGLNEARTPDGLLGDDRLAAVLRGCAGFGAGAIAARLEHAALSPQRHRPRDDVAIAVARVTG